MVIGARRAICVLVPADEFYRRLEGAVAALEKILLVNFELPKRIGEAQHGRLADPDAWNARRFNHRDVNIRPLAAAIQQA